MYYCNCINECFVFVDVCTFSWNTNFAENFLITDKITYHYPLAYWHQKAENYSYLESLMWFCPHILRRPPNDNKLGNDRDNFYFTHPL